MSGERKYDIIVFGASGFAGKLFVEEIARISDEEGGLNWAISGRSMEKLQTVLANASKATGKDLKNIPIVIADTSSEKSLVEMAKQTKIVLNCVGPFRFHGEKVVKACIEGGASHVDISGEEQFLEKTQLLYNEKAKKSGVYVIGSCGFDSLPAELGVVFSQKKFQGEINSIESYLVIEAKSGLVGNATTYESIIHGTANKHELVSLRKSLFPTSLPTPKYQLSKRAPLHMSEVINQYCFPFEGSDKSVVDRTQRYNFENRKQRPIQYEPYFARGDMVSVVGMMIIGLFLAVLTKFSFTRNLMIKYPEYFSFGVFSKTGPTKKQIEDTSFSMTFVCKGWANKLDDPAKQHTDKPEVSLTTKVMGPEPGYVTMPICAVQCIVCMLKEKNKLPKDGGVYPPGAVFADTTLIDRLQKNNIKFLVVKEQSPRP